MNTSKNTFYALFVCAIFSLNTTSSLSKQESVKILENHNIDSMLYDFNPLTMSRTSQSTGLIASGRMTPPATLIASGRMTPPATLIASGRMTPPATLIASGRMTPPAIAMSLNNKLVSAMFT